MNRSSDNESLRAMRGLLLVLKREFSQAESILKPIAEKRMEIDPSIGPKLGMAISRAWQGDEEGPEFWLSKSRTNKKFTKPAETAEDYIRNPPQVPITSRE